MNFLQKLVTRFVPQRIRAGMEAESRTWMIRCPACGFERSVWEAGGVRYKASGTSWTFLRCGHCGKRTWHKVYRPKTSGQ